MSDATSSPDLDIDARLRELAAEQIEFTKTAQAAVDAANAKSASLERQVQVLEGKLEQAVQDLAAQKIELVKVAGDVRLIEVAAEQAVDALVKEAMLDEKVRPAYLEKLKTDHRFALDSLAKMASLSRLAPDVGRSFGGQTKKASAEPVAEPSGWSGLLASLGAGSR